MDQDRRDQKAAQWKSEGHKGPAPPALMQESELPPFYRRDIGEEMAEQAAAEEMELEGRGRRAKEQVRYTDGLTDDQWLSAMENSDDDVEEASDRKRHRVEKRQARKRVNEILAQAEAEGKPLNTIKLNLDAGGAGKKEETSSLKGVKRKPRPSASTTPSIAGEDMPTVSVYRLLPLPLPSLASLISAACNAQCAFSKYRPLTYRRNDANWMRMVRLQLKSPSCGSCSTRRML